jgi:hypothetical protein
MKKPNKSTAGNGDPGFYIFLVISGVLASGMIGAVLQDKATTRYIHREAAEAGAGEYVIVDPATGKTEFRWITTKEQENE